MQPSSGWACSRSRGVRVRDGAEVRAHAPAHGGGAGAFLKDREGRLSHHKRAGWFSPFHAAWINLRATFVYGSEFFTFRPGSPSSRLGLLLTLPLAYGPQVIGRVTFSPALDAARPDAHGGGLRASTSAASRRSCTTTPETAPRRWTRIFPYTRTVLCSAVAFVVGGALAAALLVDYLRSSLALTAGGPHPVPGRPRPRAHDRQLPDLLLQPAPARVVMRAEAIYGGSQR